MLLSLLLARKSVFKLLLSWLPEAKKVVKVHNSNHIQGKLTQAPTKTLYNRKLCIVSSRLFFKKYAGMAL